MRHQVYTSCARFRGPYTACGEVGLGSITAGPWASTPELGTAELALPRGRWDSQVFPLPSQLCRRSPAFSPSSTHSLSPPLTFPELRLLRTLPGSPRTRPQLQGTQASDSSKSDLSLPTCVRTPSFGAIRSPLANAQPQIARPLPPLTWAGLGCSGTDRAIAPQTGSAQLTAPGPGSIYGWPHPLLPVPRNFWKVGNASGGRRGSERRKKAKDLPQTTLAPAPVPAGSLPAPGSYCPLALLGRGDSPPAPARPWEPGHSWDSAVLDVEKQGLDSRVN
jgi:hypothetical protein